MKRSILAISVLVVFAAITAVSSFAEDVPPPEVTPLEAYALVADDDNAYILDVRTLAEWTWVGHPGENKLEEGSELTGKVVNISFRIEKKKEWIVNPSFVNDVDGIFGGNQNVTLYCICRSGDRSKSAAKKLIAAGYNAISIETGFEGGKDDYGYRTVNGWANDGLPYKFSSPKTIDGYDD